MDRDFPQAGKAAPWNFPWASPLGNPSEQPCQPSENSVHPSSFTWINPVHAQELVPASIISRNGTGWYKLREMYCGICTSKHLLREKLNPSHKIPLVR